MFRTTRKADPARPIHAALLSATLALSFAASAMLALLPAPALAAVQGSGKTATEQRTLPEFQAIDIGGSMHLTVRQGAQQSLQLQADDNLLPLLETVVENGKRGPTLHVRFKRGESVYPRARLAVTVVVPKLAAVSAAGAGNIRIERFDTPALLISVAGAGDVQLDAVTAGELDVQVAGSGDVSGNGKAARLKLGIAGSGDVKLASLAADDVTIKIAGSGDAAVQALKTLDVSIGGSGDVSYSGNPTLKTSVAGSGSVRRKP